MWIITYFYQNEYDVFHWNKIYKNKKNALIKYRKVLENKCSDYTDGSEEINIDTLDDESLLNYINELINDNTDESEICEFKLRIDKVYFEDKK